MPSRPFPLTLVILLAGCGGQNSGGAPQHAGASGQGGSLTNPAGGASAHGGASGQGGSLTNPAGGASAHGGVAGFGGNAGSGGVQCNGYPSCQPEESPLMGGSTCPPESVCREVTLCGNTILCASGPDASAGGAGGAGGAGDVQCVACDSTSCTANNVWVEHSAACCECRVCPLGFVACDRGAALCVRTDPDSDGDGCCACYTP